MAPQGIDPEPYITEYTSIYEDDSEDLEGDSEVQPPVRQQLHLPPPHHRLIQGVGRVQG